jgi:hypothetical protein
MNFQPIAAFLGFLGAVILLGSVARWIYAISATRRERRSSGQSDGPAKSPVWSLLPVVLLHSGPWALGIAIFCMYYALSQPRSPYLSWFLGGALAGLFFTVILVAKAMHRGRGWTATHARDMALGNPAKPHVSLGDDTNESYRVRLWMAFWASIPGTLFLSALWWQSITRTPALCVVLAILSFLFSYFLGWLFKFILFPKPWRVPPPK